MTFVFSSESVTEGHPDKVADRISDSVLDALFKLDPHARVACETMVATEFVCLAGEITGEGSADVDYEAIARNAVREIGYTDKASGLGVDTANILTDRLVPQSEDIYMGVGKKEGTGAGDQGMMFGYAEAPTDGLDTAYMPVPIHLAHQLTKQLTKVRKDGTLGYLRPDGKSQVSVRFDNGKPVAVDTIVLAAQHEEGMSHGQIQHDLIEKVVRPIIPEDWLHGDTQYFVNHTGKFVQGGPSADAGLTGRKIIVDTYGGWVPHGGGAFSGKDPTKVDRSAAYYARYVAKNLVAADVADKLQIQVAYSIGSLQPVSINVQTFGTGKMPERDIERIIRQEFDFAPGALIEELDLRQPIYTPTSSYGHMGRSDLNLPWEKLDRVEDLKARVGQTA